MTDHEAEQNCDVLNAGVPEKLNSEEQLDLPARLSQPKFVLEEREKKLAIIIESRVEKRMTSVMRQESGDSYAGLPADHVLINLDAAFPAVHFPERMMARLELEQQARQKHEEQQDKLDHYEAETRRIDAEQERTLVNSGANRAVVVLVLLLVVGGGLTFFEHETVGGVVLGTTLFSVVGAFLSQRIRGKS